MNGNIHLGKTIGSILIILLLMPLGHALMIIMEHLLSPTVLHYSAFTMGFVGLVVTIWHVDDVYRDGDSSSFSFLGCGFGTKPRMATRQLINGLMMLKKQKGRYTNVGMPSTVL